MTTAALNEARSDVGKEQERVYVLEMQAAVTKINIEAFLGVFDELRQQKGKHLGESPLDGCTL